MKMTTMLIIMDGYGIAAPGPGNAISIARTPALDALRESWPHTALSASGKAVGLPDGQMGNSEVGHLNMGAGRVVWQDLSRITECIDRGSFFENTVFLQAMEHAKARNSTLHLMGLVSDGGVHSHLDHALALVDLAEKNDVPRIRFHAILDGRDVGPKSAGAYIEVLEQHLESAPNTELASLAGRYYTMDRDKRWERVRSAYRAYTLGEGQRGRSAQEMLQQSYDEGITDEFVLPTLLEDESGNISLIREGDSVIFFNFRPDRAREIAHAFVDEPFDAFDRGEKLADLHYVCLTEYDATLPSVHVAYPPQPMEDTLGEVLSACGKTQLRIAETEKYAHVTFFFNGGIEPPLPGEERVLIPSPHVPTYDLQPEMSAPEVTKEAIRRIRSRACDVIVLNLANCDMVGHTGVLPATVQAVETVDRCVGQLVEAVLSEGGCALITSDHGNADRMLDEQGRVVTAHSTAPVPLILVGRPDAALAEGGRLCDVAPTLLHAMDLPIPKAMTGRSLIKDARHTGRQRTPMRMPMSD